MIPPVAAIVLSKSQFKDAQPDPFYEKRVFLWFPHIFAPAVTIFCAHCGSPNTSTHGAPTKPQGRRVVSMFDTFYIIGYRHSCKGCGKTFMNYDPRTVAKMPLWVQLCFSADLTHRSGIDIQSQKLITALINNCVPVAKVHAIFKELQTSTHTEHEAAYYDKLCAMKKTCLQFCGMQ